MDKRKKRHERGKEGGKDTIAQDSGEKDSDVKDSVAVSKARDEKGSDVKDSVAYSSNSLLSTRYVAVRS